MFDIRTNPFGLIVVLDSNGNANGDLFYDDGETIDTIETNAYFYATYAWSSQKCQLNITILQNNYTQMSSLILNSLAIYGLMTPPTNITVNGNQVSAVMRSNTEIVDVTGLGLAMTNNYIVTWSCQNQTGSNYTQGNTTSTGMFSQTTTTSHNRSPPNSLSKNVFLYIFVLFLVIMLRWCNNF